MFLRIDKLQIELPLPKEPEPNAAAALQELLGGKYGEMSTLGNYLFQKLQFPQQVEAQAILQFGGEYNRRGAGPRRAR